MRFVARPDTTRLSRPWPQPMLRHPFATIVPCLFVCLLLFSAVSVLHGTVREHGHERPISGAGGACGPPLANAA
ncbi:hypothetical protein XAP412_960044 [Xanthomonas phaseoli pv. phaseoli]|uniref:Secreted protein n=1 Tax=Xanthomonas campestris pv. phaseoli TaxID=317013 RepID=A0AB38E7N9_XANCH|nr:hypothetical protein XAP6984_990046 [Xanthomonas phaseoli pv. phaseoli]SON91815.1 hypothetical protein XAP412_960044 [Xanthomonas phaseoli pv. phaseoli]SON93147.1 hypothetical protein XAP7430_980046 [Xanthomonas phaseoli pv. phaseoli]SOO30168.1 hypothetical protein XAP6164_4130008 [Xanthomonas phaseoli pv. phaseoli]